MDQIALLDLLARAQGQRQGTSALATTLETLRSLTRQGVRPDYETLLERAYRSFLAAGDCVADVGAHRGRHTGVFAEIVGPQGRVLAFEPLPEYCRMLRQRFAEWPGVTVHEVALGANSGASVAFIHARNAPAYSGLRARRYDCDDPDPVETEVALGRLDDYLPPSLRPRYLKLDIEGGELDCLRGATACLARHRPIVSAEYGIGSYAAYGHSADSLYDFAAARDYAIVDLFGNLIADRALWLRTCDQAYWDYLLVPREEAESVAARLHPTQAGAPA